MQILILFINYIFILSVIIALDITLQSNTTFPLQEINKPGNTDFVKS